MTGSGVRGLTQRGGSFMWPTRSDRAPAGSVHYAVNMVPVSVSRDDSSWVTRGQFINIGTSTAGGGNVVAMGQLHLADGTGITWFLTSNAGIWTVNWATGAYTNTVTAANFATASVTVGSGTHYWCVFNNGIVFNPSDGTNKAFFWDGSSGAGGVSTISNSSVAYGRPTVYYGKLFLIKYAERNTIIWSEENTVNTGYEAGGYNNAWKLSQTGTAPLYVILATNTGLYYFRDRSIGVIRGAVNSTFTTTGIHDAVSSQYGTLSPAGACVASDDVWFVNQWGVPCLILSGGQPRQILDEMEVDTDGTEPFGFDPVGWSRSIGAGLTVEVVAVPPQARMNYETVWFNVPAATPTATRAALVFSRETTRPLAWFVPYTSALKPYLSVVRDSQSSLSIPAWVDASTGRLLAMGYLANPDTNASGTAQTTTVRLIGAPLGGNDLSDFRFDRCAVEVGGGTNVSLGIQALTSRQNSLSAMSAAQSVTVSTGTEKTLTRKVVGWNQAGRWVRPVFTVSSSTAVDIVLDGWTVTATPVFATAGIP